MELWSEIITEKSYDLLLELKKNVDFVLIGGWANWLYSQTAKSKDIDIYINFNDLFKLQNFFINKGISVNYNRKLNKYEIKTEEIDIDIYTPDHCNLIISCKEVFNKSLFKDVSGFKVVIPEVLLILKLDAEKQRHGTIKGFKDRIDILSLLYKTKFDISLLAGLAKEHKVDLKGIKEIITKSSKEYSYFFQKAENLRELKKLKLWLIKEMKIFF